MFYFLKRYWLPPVKIHHLYTYVYFSLVYFISKIDTKVKMHIDFACFFVIYPCLVFLIFFPWGDQEKVGITERTGLFISLCTTSYQPCVPRDVCFPVWETWKAHIPCHKIKHHSVQHTFCSLQPYFQLYFQSYYIHVKIFDICYICPIVSFLQIFTFLRYTEPKI